MPAWLKHDALKSMTVKAGQTARWDVKIGGEPAPAIKWTKNDAVLEEGGTLQVPFFSFHQPKVCLDLFFVKKSRLPVF